MTKPPKRTLVDLEIVSLFLSELFGTAILVYLSCSGSLTWHPSIPVNGLQAAFCSGFAVLICVQIFGSISGAHINPCVTVAALICDSINIKASLSTFHSETLKFFLEKKNGKFTRLAIINRLPLYISLHNSLALLWALVHY